MRKRAYIIIAVIAILSLSITAGELFFSGTPTAKKYTSEDSKAYIALKEDISENAPCQQRRYLRFLKIIHGLLYIAPVVVLILGIIFNGKHIHISFS